MESLSESGIAIQFIDEDSYSYFETNALGDWTLGGSILTADLFDNENDALQAVDACSVEAYNLVFIKRQVTYEVNDYATLAVSTKFS